MPVIFPLEIFYDGSCRVCSTEMEMYRKHSPQDRLIFIDISDSGFQPQAYGKPLKDFMARIHVRDGTGHFATGVDAFILIWQVFPDFSFYRLLSAVVGFPGINLLSRGGYTMFARYRHLLPKKNDDCDSGTCHLKNPH